MIRTRVGYAGGTTENPTYAKIGDHAETIQIDYDPTKIAYADLLEQFWASHDPSAKPVSRQYSSIIFYHNEEQKKLALATKDREAARRKKGILTEVLPATRFHLAEGYHQKYWLQHVPALIREFNAFYSHFNDIVDSTAAARINGYLRGYGNLENLNEDIVDFGLSPEGDEVLLNYAYHAAT